MVASIQTVIIGAGQGGVSMSYFLKQHGREHTILDKASQPGNSWRNPHWDSVHIRIAELELSTSGKAYDGPDTYGSTPT